MFLDPRAAPVSFPPDLRLDPTYARHQREAAVWVKAHPLRIGAPYRENGPGPYLWVSDTRGALWQTVATQSAISTGKQVVGAIYDCAAPEGMKFDAHGNLWVACQGTSTVNMYAPKATKATRVLREIHGKGSSLTYPFPDDVGFDAAGNVYVSNGYTFTGRAHSIGDVDVFLAKSRCGGLPCNNAEPDMVLVNPHSNKPCPSFKKWFSCTTISGPSFIDVGPHGKVYIDFSIEVSACKKDGITCKITSSVIGVDAIRGALTATPFFEPLVRGLTGPRGVYLTSKGAVLNVLHAGDVLGYGLPHTNTITRYAVSPFQSIGSLGPLPDDAHFGDCFPSAMGFNQTETLVAAGDITCHAAVVGNVSKNRFVPQLDWAFGALQGAAFEPSDK